jgi:dolichol-phosphate mannosyltransferase
MERKPRVSVILPTYNEGGNIGGLVSEIRKFLGKEAEIVVSDDNSPDGTWKIVREMAKTDKNLKLLRRFKNKGVGPAIYDGVMKSKGEYIVWMDADLTMPPSLLPRMVSMLKEYDVVVGSRYAQGGGDKRSVLRVITSIAINRVANLLLNFKVLDYDSGFVAVRREVFEKVRFSPNGHGEYCIEFLYKCTKKGYSVREIGFVFTERKMGESKTSQYLYSIFLHGFKYLKKIIELRLSVK